MKRNFSVHARTTEKEYRALNMIAVQEGVTPSEVLRLLLRSECRRKGLDIGLVDFYKEFPATPEVEALNGQPVQR